MSTLVQEIEENRRKMHTDSYPMSIGELINLYRDEEIDIHPEFQRIYRWSNSQKSKLIESILLGIPLPSIFVAQRTDGIWDVVDGLQRLSTIFSFIGILKDENQNLLKPLELTGTEYLPALQGIVWSNDEGTDKELSADLKRAFKREKIDIKIIKKESDENAKYDLFQRLNTGGSSLSPQEVRNCLLIMINHDIYDWLKKLSENENFKNCIPLSAKQEEEQGYMELVLRFVVYRHIENEEVKKYSDLTDMLTGSLQAIFIEKNLDLVEEEKVFYRVFNLLSETLEDNSFRKYNQSKAKYMGAFSLSLFELIAIGLSFSKKTDEELKERIENISKMIPEDEYFLENTKYGTRSINRFQILTEYGKAKFI